MVLRNPITRCPNPTSTRLCASGKHPFSHRLIISTTDKWGKNAEDACDNQQIPVQRIGLADIAPRIGIPPLLSGRTKLNVMDTINYP
jgi:hypothetical protein